MTERNGDPHFMFITNGDPIRDYQINQIGYIQLEGKRHYVIHYNQEDNVKRPNYFEICGHELSAVAINVEINFRQLVYVLSRLRQPYARPLTEEEKVSCYPIFAHREGYIRIGDKEFHREIPSQPDIIDRLQEAWEDYWDNA